MGVHTRLKMVKSRLRTFVAGLGRVSLDTGTSRYAMAGSDLLLTYSFLLPSALGSGSLPTVCPSTGYRGHGQ